MKISTLLLAASIALSAAPCAWAGDGDAAESRSFSTLTRSPDTQAAFAALKKGHRLPAWITRDVVESPAHTVSFDGHDVYVASACKPHDCGSDRIAILYDPQKKVMYGLVSIAGAGKDTEQLTWLNIGDGNESIDGRTILYAALTGSLENHPGAFNYR